MDTCVVMQLPLIATPRPPVPLPRPGAVVPEFSYEFPRVTGTFGAYFPATSRREVRRGWEVEVDGQFFSPTSLARAIVRARRGRRWPEEATTRRLVALRPPTLCRVGVWRGEWVFVDIRRAFESVLCGWGVRWVDPLRYFSVTPAWEVPPRFWEGPGEKYVYRTLPAVSLPGRVRVETAPAQFREMPRPPLDARPWGTVCGVLWGVAAEAAARGAVYWNVDGGIVPASFAEELIDLCAEVGLELREVARGDVAHVRALGAYALADRVSGHFARVRRGREVALEADLAEWGREILRRC